jgi:hypothetical protein
MTDKPSMFGRGQEADPFPGERTAQMTQPMCEDAYAKIRGMGFDADLARNLIEIVRVSFEAGKDESKARIEELEGALRDLVNEIKNPGDGCEFEDGEWPALDRARKAVSSADRGEG